MSIRVTRMSYLVTLKVAQVGAMQSYVFCHEKKILRLGKVLIYRMTEPLDVRILVVKA